MNLFRFAARSGEYAPLSFAVVGVLLAMIASTACGGDDDDDASKGFIGTNYPAPPRLGPRDADAGTPSAQQGAAATR